MESEDLLDFEKLDCQIQSIIDRSELQYCLKMQLEETDILRAMYYQEKEFIIDETILEKVNNYVAGTTFEVPPSLEFFINLTIDSIALEVRVLLPKLYPNILPKISVRSNQFTRNQQNNINHGLESFLLSLDRGAICIYECISWMNDNACKFQSEHKDVIQPKTAKHHLFSRYWIYSHHIYSKEKRKQILSLSQQCNVTGFCLSGKPGIICGEGLSVDCLEWWQKIRSMTWKKIMCKKIEEIKLETASCDPLRKFNGFSEIGFQNMKNHKAQEKHTDMGEFYRYLVQHDCGHVFRDYFGIEGKSS